MSPVCLCALVRQPVVFTGVAVCFVRVLSSYYGVGCVMMLKVS